jgi:hypothetical protein
MKNQLQQQNATQADHLKQSGVQRRQFESAEEMIRADREGMEVPGSVGERLAQSIATETPSSVPPARPWWKRLWGG